MAVNVSALPVSLRPLSEDLNAPATAAATALLLYSMFVAAFVMLGAKIGKLVGERRELCRLNGKTQDGGQILLARKVRPPHGEHACSAGEGAAGNLVDDAVCFRVCLFGECDGPGLLVDGSVDDSVDVH